ncbi:GerAB/ArcD/ProY family transporter [Paenibacillus humicola]|uniref:GerAB/ArcD/ProY family transporter n=1 Tax=Paenibacillus humicola TaxID=3110540 RepID=UPI00237BC393|nr:endospore germination permease [Paenibacillus humicola]
MKVTERITGTQLGMLLFSFVFPALVIPAPGIMAAFAKQNAWISVFPGALLGVTNIWVMTALSNRYPGLTILEYTEKIVGKWLGKALSLYFFYYWYSLVTVVINEHSRFLNTFLLPRTPTIVGGLTIVVLSALAVYAGIEVIGRCNSFLTVLIIMFLLPLFVLALQDTDIKHLMPVLGEGIVPVLQGSFPVSANINQVFLLGWLIPFLKQRQKARRAGMIALFGIVTLIVTVNLLTVMIFGPITGKLTYSFLSLIQYIGIQGSFERLEAIAVAIWVFGIFVKVSVGLFMLSLCLSHVFGIRNYRDIVAPLALLALVGAVWSFTTKSDYQQFETFTYPLWAIVTQNLLPAVLLAADAIKRKASGSLL